MDRGEAAVAVRPELTELEVMTGELEALRRRERWLRAYFENSPDLVLRLDKDATILEGNPAAARKLGSRVSALRGQPSERLGLSERALASWRVAVEQVYTSRHDHSLEVTLETADGPRVHTARLSAVVDDADQVEFVGAILQDITERVRAEQQVGTLQREMLEREDRLQQLLSTYLGERGRLRERARAWGLAALTDRERAILRQMANGHTNREIGHRLRMSAGTVRNRISLLLPKLGAADRTQAVAIALQFGLLGGPTERVDDAGVTAPLLHYNLGEID